MRHQHVHTEANRVDNHLVTTQDGERQGLPKRLLTGFEVAAFIGCHEETVRRAVAANEFAIPRMPADRQRPIESLEEARTWERHFIGELEAGRDPRRPRKARSNTDATPKTVSAFLDAYMERCVKPAGLRSLPSVQSRVAVLKR